MVIAPIASAVAVLDEVVDRRHPRQLRGLVQVTPDELAVGVVVVDRQQHLAVAADREGLDRRTAVEKAAMIRLRPILMTTLATGAGLAPLLLATGPGAEARFATSLVPAAGMFVGTLFTLFVLPAFYTVIASERQVAQGEGVVEPERQAVS